MKNIIIIILVFIVSESLYSQKWGITFGDPYRNDISLDVVENYDKGYLISGEYEYTACWLMKTDINGNLLWEKYFEDETYSNVFFTVVPDNEGNIYLFGWTLWLAGWLSLNWMNAAKNYGANNSWMISFGMDGSVMQSLQKTVTS